MLGLGIKLDNLVSFNSSLNYSGSLFYITNPEPRDEINNGDSINLTATAINASSVSFSYRDQDGNYTTIGSATNTSGNTWTYSAWSPSEPATYIKATATYPDSTTQETTTLVYSVGLEDTFTDTNGTLLSAHTPDSVLNTGWTIVSGAWDINTNRLDIDTADTNRHYVTTDAGTSCIIEFSIGAGAAAANSNHQIVINYVDTDNYVQATFNYFTKQMNLGYYTAGAYTAIATGDDVGFEFDETMQLIVNDDRLVVRNLVDLSETTPYDIPYYTTATKYGFARPGANNDYFYNDFKIIPLTLPELDTSVTYSQSKLGSYVISKNAYPAFDKDGVNSPSFYQDGSTNYMIFTTKNTTTGNSGITYATAPSNDIHNWTRHNDLILAYDDSPTDTQITAVTSYWDGSNLTVLYDDIFTGIIKYATGTGVNDLTKQGTLVDLTGSGLYCRHPNLVYHNGIFYLYLDIRRDGRPGGHLGHISVGSASTIVGLSSTTYRECLSTPGYYFDGLDAGAPSVRYNESNGYWEMLFSGFLGGYGDFLHEPGLAISKNPLNNFVRVDTEPLIPTGTSGSIDYVITAPEWYLDNDIVYYVGKASGGSQDGITYTTLS